MNDELFAILRRLALLVGVFAISASVLVELIRVLLPRFVEILTTFIFSPGVLAIFLAIWMWSHRRKR